MKTYVYQNVLVIIAYENSKIWKNGLRSRILQDKIVKKSETKLKILKDQTFFNTEKKCEQLFTRLSILRGKGTIDPTPMLEKL